MKVVYLLLWKIWKSVGIMKFPIWWEKNKCSKPPTSNVLPQCWKASHHSALLLIVSPLFLPVERFFDFTQFRVITCDHTYMSVFVLNIYLLALHCAHASCVHWLGGHPRHCEWLAPWMYILGSSHQSACFSNGYEIHVKTRESWWTNMISYILTI